MPQDFIHIDLFDQYINNELNQSEKANFEQRLKGEEAFAKEFNFYQDMLKGMAYAEEEKMKATLAGVQEELQAENFFSNAESMVVAMSDAKKRFWLKPLSIAASLLILIAAGFYLFTNSNSTFNAKEAYANFYKPEKEKLSVVLDRLEARGLADPEEGKKDSLVNALRHYENFEYAEATVSLDEYLKRYSEDNIAKLYMGLSLLHQSQFDKATAQLMPIAENKDFEYQSTAKWYLALAYTQLGTPESKEKAIVLLNQLVQQNEVYTKEAAAYLQGYK